GEDLRVVERVGARAHDRVAELVVQEAGGAEEQGLEDPAVGDAPGERAWSSDRSRLASRVRAGAGLAPGEGRALQARQATGYGPAEEVLGGAAAVTDRRGRVRRERRADRLGPHHRRPGGGLRAVARPSPCRSRRATPGSCRRGRRNRRRTWRTPPTRSWR